jgi:predicted TIM-barrel fold metal-dependent hydrolase
METEWDLDDPLGEIDHIEGVQRRYGLPDAAVAHAVLADPNVEDVLERLADRPIVRGVRNKPGQASTPERAAAEPTLMTDDRWRRGYARLAAHGLDFELQTAWWHLDEAVGSAVTSPTSRSRSTTPAYRRTAAVKGLNRGQPPWRGSRSCRMCG